MSGLVIEEFWHLNNYFYPFYRFIIENYCKQSIDQRPCLMLDAGCGQNICSISKVPEGMTVVALDVSRKEVHFSYQKAKKKDYKNFFFVIGSITSLPIKDQIFDICICVDVLEHLSNKNKAIAEISRICKPGAKFIGSTSNSLNPLLLFDCYMPKGVVRVLTEKFAPGHCERHRRLNLKKLLQALQRANFHIKNMKILGFPPFQPWLYQFSNRKIPWYAYMWILLNKITDKRPLNFLKEAMVFQAIKNGQHQLTTTVNLN